MSHDNNDAVDNFANVDKTEHSTHTCMAPAEPLACLAVATHTQPASHTQAHTQAFVPRMHTHFDFAYRAFASFFFFCFTHLFLIMI